MSAMLWFRVGALMMALGVILGAFGAHALKNKLQGLGTTGIWQTAVLYHFVHGIGLFVVGWMLMGHQAPLLNWSGSAFLVGTILFSGSLYTLALTGSSWVGALTPIGGLLFIVGWLLLAFFK